MKSYLSASLKYISAHVTSVRQISFLQFAKSKGNKCCAVLNKKIQLSAALSVFITLIFLISGLSLKAQITDTTIFPLNEYLYTTPVNPYPIVDSNKVNAIDKSRFVNVMDYGAKGDGKTLDDVAITNAFKAAQYGVIFPSGRTFLVSKLSKIILTHDLTVYAYGATIKMAALSKYSFLSLEYQQGSYHNNVIWLGGTFDGNSNSQAWPGSPTGNNTWAEDHGRFLGICYAAFAMVKDVNVINTVVDGVGIDACKLGVITDSKASGGAVIKYNQVQEQGTYFKFTRVGLKACYFLNLTCTGGSIGTHVSYPTKVTMDNETLSVHVNCHFYNQVQNAIHIEDCYKNFFYNCTISADTGYQYNQSLHLSNRTGIVSIKSCQFTNARVNFNNATSLKLAIIDSCQFVSEFKGYNSPLNTFIEGRPTVCINTTFSGRTALKYQGALKNIRKCTFSNFDSLAISGGYAIDSNTFVSGTKPAALSKGGFVMKSTYRNVKDTLYKTTPTDNTWNKVYLSYINIFSDTKRYLGRITCGGNAASTTQSQLTATASAKTTLSNSTDKKYIGCNTCGSDSARNKLLAITAAETALNAGKANLQSQRISLYPNPAVNEVHISLNEKVWGKTVLNVYDQQGRLVQTKTIYKNTPVTVETISATQLTSGAYVLQIINEHEKSALKFVIAK